MTARSKEVIPTLTCLHAKNVDWKFRWSRMKKRRIPSCSIAPLIWGAGTLQSTCKMGEIPFIFLIVENMNFSKFHMCLMCVSQIIFDTQWEQGQKKWLPCWFLLMPKLWIGSSDDHGWKKKSIKKKNSKLQQSSVNLRCKYTAKHL